MFKYEKLSVLISCIPFLSHAGAGVRVVEPVAAAEHDSEEDRSMDPDDSRDYADQFPYPDDPDSPGSINDENLESLASIMKLIPECINKQISTVCPTFFHTWNQFKLLRGQCKKR